METFLQYQEFINNNWPLFILLAAWTLIWKGIALWKAARHSDKVWFVVMLIVNSIGILEIIYIFAVARKKELPAQP